MIFDLLTLKDPFNRWRIFPNSEYDESELSKIFTPNGHVSSYNIEEGRYFQWNDTWYGEGNYFKVNFENIIEYGQKRDVNTIVFEYRANHPFYVTTLTAEEEVVEEFEATDVFKKGSIRFIETIEHYGIEDAIVFTLHTHEDNRVHEGDYLIIRKFEFLTV